MATLLTNAGATWVRAPGSLISFERERRLGSHSGVRFRTTALRWLLELGLLATLMVISIRLLGLESGLTRTGILIAAGGAAFGFLHLAMDLRAWAAIPGAVVFVLHPLVVGVDSGSAPLSSDLVLAAVPLAFLGAWHAATCGRVWACALLGLVLGITIGLDTVAGALLATAALFFAGTVALPVKARAREWRRWSLLVLSVLVVGGIAFLAMRWSLPDSTAWSPTADSEQGFRSVSPGPLAWIDRDRALSERLHGLPDELTAGTAYLGWSVMGLCLAAVWPGRRSSRRAAALVVIGLATAWLTRSESLHAQWQSLLASATVERHIDTTTLNLLGLAAIPMLLLSALVLLAVCRLGSQGARARLPGLLVGFTAVLMWWSWSPASLPHGNAMAAALVRAPSTTELMIFTLVCTAAVGIQRLVGRCATRPGRVGAWVVLIAVLAADLAPLVRSASQPGEPPSNPNVSAAESIAPKYEGVRPSLTALSLQAVPRACATLPCSFDPTPRIVGDAHYRSPFDTSKEFHDPRQIFLDTPENVV